MDGIKQNVNYFIMDGTMVVHPLLFHQTSFVVLQNISKNTFTPTHTTIKRVQRHAR
jgi:hypothetical protein